MKPVPQMKEPQQMKPVTTIQLATTINDTLDGLFGVGCSTVRVGAGYPRPQSDGDLADQDTHEKIIEDLTESQLNEKLEEILNDMNLTEAKKLDVRNLPDSNKRTILLNHYKDRNKLDKPSDFIRYLNMNDLSLNKLYDCVASLKVSLANNPLSWVQEFGSEGLKALLHTLNRCYSSNDRKHDLLQKECLRCIWTIMNNTVGLKEVFRQNEALVMVARSLEASRPPVMAKALQILAAACLVPHDGHGKVLEAITINGELKECDRFAPIVAGLQIPNNDPLRVLSMQLINAIVSTPDEVDFKIHLRNEMMRVGLIDLLEVLEKDASEDLALQLKVFNDQKEDDFYEFSQRFDNLRLEFDDVNECFEVLKNFVMDTPSEPYFLSILQHLLFIRDDSVVRPAYFKLIEECITQIVLHKGGTDPDFGGSNFQIDVQNLIENLTEKSKNEDEERINGLQKQIEELSAKQQEKDAELALAKKTISEFQATGGIPNPKKSVGPTAPPMPVHIPIPPPMMGGDRPIPPPMPGGPLPPLPPPFPVPRLEDSMICALKIEEGEKATSINLPILEDSMICALKIKEGEKATSINLPRSEDCLSCDLVKEEEKEEEEVEEEEEEEQEEKEEEAEEKKEKEEKEEEEKEEEEKEVEEKEEEEEEILLCLPGLSRRLMPLNEQQVPDKLCSISDDMFPLEKLQILSEKSKNEYEERINGLQKQIEELSAKQQEKDAELALAKKTISEFEATGGIPLQILKKSVGPPAPPMPGHIPIPPPMMGGGGPIPPPMPGGPLPPLPPPFPVPRLEDSMICALKIEEGEKATSINLPILEDSMICALKIKEGEKATSINLPRSEDCLSCDLVKEEEKEEEEVEEEEEEEQEEKEEEAEEKKEKEEKEEEEKEEEEKEVEEKEEEEEEILLCLPGLSRRLMPLNEQQVPDKLCSISDDMFPLEKLQILSEKSKNEYEERINGLQKQIEELSAKQQEKDAELALAKKTISEFEATGGIPLQILKKSVGPPAPPMPGHIPIPPPMMGGGGPIPPPMPGGPLPPLPPPFPGSRPPPPPMMGMMPPPPFPGMGPPLPKPPDSLPLWLKPKKKWNVKGIKRANWKTISPQNISEKSYWANVEEEKLATPEILGGLTAKFSPKPLSDDVVDQPGTLKKVKQLQVLDGKAAQNLSILLGGPLKHLSYTDVKRYILKCDTQILTETIIDSLISYLPPPDQMKRFSELKTDYKDLTEAEQFAFTLAEIKRLLPRLKSLKFKIHHPEMVQDIKPSIVAGISACEEVKKSKKLAKTLELILLIGNYMNSGTRIGQAFGFEISFLPKLSSTKDLENKTTLMHYLADIIERNFPELLTVRDELMHVDRAARVSIDTIQKSLNTMDSNLKNLETDITNNKIPLNEDDKFLEVMGDFSKQARQECAVLKNMFQKLETLNTDLAEYYAFDKQKYTLEEFFSDLNIFLLNFYASYKENVDKREQEKKARRAKEAREKAEVEKAERAARKRALVDMTESRGNQGGVMVSLLETIQTGSAFSRYQRQKRNYQPRPVGAERRAQLNRSRSRTGLVNRELARLKTEFQ